MMLCSVLRDIRLSKKLCRCISNVSKREYSAVQPEVVQNEEVVIPAYIPRSKTDILRALETTIRRDPTSPHFKYHDDPYLYPMSNYKKRVYALAQESGRKAAHWIRQEHKELFMFSVSDPPLRKLSPYKNADPPIEAYIPRPTYDEESNVTEQDLKTVIKNNLVSDAVLVYKLLKAKDPDSISDETKQELLEFLCYFNENDQVPPEWVEEKWFSQRGPGGGQRVIRWMNEGLAMNIFSNIDEKTPAAYCAMISGMCKYFQANMAYKLYEECLQKNLLLNTDAYNGLLSVVGFLKENTQMQWDLITSLLVDMNAKGITPNLATFNSILESISYMNDPLIRDYALQIFAEMTQKCNIEPSLATWTFMMNIFYKDKTPNNDLLYKIMEKLQGQSLTIKDHRDILFFTTAMNVCRYKIQDLKLGKRIHELLLHAFNYNLIGDSYRENVYYRNYFSLVVRNASLEGFMEVYNDLVPHVYVPETSIMHEIIRAIDVNGSIEYYPLLWSHLLMFGLASHQNLVEFLLESMVRNIPAETVSEENKLPVKSASNNTANADIESLSLLSHEEKFANIAWEIWKKVEDKIEGRVEKLTWTASMLNDIIYLLSRAGRYDDANMAVQALSKSGGSIGVPSSSDALIYFVHGAVKNGTPSYTVPALSYLAECGFTESVDVSIEVLQKLLNRNRDEVKELAEQVAAKNTSTWSSDATLSNLLAIVNNEKSTITKESYRSRQSDTSSDSSDSDSESDVEK